LALLDQMVKPVGNFLVRDQLWRALIVACEFRDVSGIGSLSALRPPRTVRSRMYFALNGVIGRPTTTSLHAFAAQGLRVAASFNINALARNIA
jgi:hypothetical protein